MSLDGIAIPGPAWLSSGVLQMKAFLKFAVPLVLLSALLGCSTTGGELPPVSKIPPGVAFEGTLANHVLAQDASLSIRNIMGGGSKRVDKFVIQKTCW